ncbi:MAG: hypothetical protein PUA90_01040 [bacterium]|nr:hypothetical protein [bacterium]
MIESFVPDIYQKSIYYINYDKLRYEKVKIKNEKLKILYNECFDIDEPTDILINGLSFIRVTKVGNIKVYALDNRLISKRKSMI